MKVLVTEPIPEKPLSLLRSQFEVDVLQRGTITNEQDLINYIKPYNGLISMLYNPITERVITAAPNLRVIANVAVGFNNIDTGAAKRAGIVVANTPDVLTDSTADFTLGLLLAVARKMLPASEYLKQGKFQNWEPLGFLGMELSGKCIGIYGMGRIGKAVAKRARSFGLDIHYYNRKRLEETVEDELQATYHPELTSLLKVSDILSVHCPLNEETYHSITSTELLQLPKGSIVINTSRGAIIKEDDLADVLLSGHLSGVGLDVFEHEPEVNPKLFTFSNAVLVPHIGSATHKTREAMGTLAAKAIIHVLTNSTDRLPNRVV